MNPETSADALKPESPPQGPDDSADVARETAVIVSAQIEERIQWAEEVARLNAERENWNLELADLAAPVEKLEAEFNRLDRYRHQVQDWKKNQPEFEKDLHELSWITRPEGGWWRRAWETVRRIEPEYKLSIQDLQRKFSDLLRKFPDQPTEGVSSLSVQSFAEVILQDETQTQGAWEVFIANEKKEQAVFREKHEKEKGRLVELAESTEVALKAERSQLQEVEAFQRHRQAISSIKTHKEAEAWCDKLKFLFEAL